MNSTTEIGQRIKHARGALGWNQASLARMCDIAPTQFSRYESGRAAPRPETIAKIAAALNVSPIWLALGEGEIEGPNVASSSPDGEPPFVVSLPPDLAVKIRQEASAKGVTMEMEMLRLLKESMEREHGDQHINTQLPNQEALEQASLRGAEEAIKRVVKSMRSIQEENPGKESYLEYMRRVFLDLDKDGNPTQSNKSRPPTIPGVNTPARQSKRKDTPKE